MDELVTTLWRPVGRNELALIAAADIRAFPPRLPEQPIFYRGRHLGSALALMTILAREPQAALRALGHQRAA